MLTRSILAVALGAILAPGAALAQDATATLSHSQLIADYPQRLADRDIAIGQGLFEANLEGSYLFYNGGSGGLAEIPRLRYGLSDKWEAVLLGIRYIVDESGHYVPGLAIRAQLHDLAYRQPANGVSTNPYPLLRPGAFVETRDKLPFHLAIDASAGYEVAIQSGNTIDGAPVQNDQRYSEQTAVFAADIQWSPLNLLSFVGTVGYLNDVKTAPTLNPNESDGYAQLAVSFTPSGRWDVRAYFKGNWFQDGSGFVPETGIGAAVRL